MGGTVVSQPAEAGAHHCTWFFDLCKVWRQGIGHQVSGIRYPLPILGDKGLDGVIMILPQVHLRKPCYDFTFL